MELMVPVGSMGSVASIGSMVNRCWWGVSVQLDRSGRVGGNGEVIETGNNLRK